MSRLFLSVYNKIGYNFIFLDLINYKIKASYYNGN